MERNLLFDFFRGISILLVFFFHYESLFPNGFLGVDIFFFISGFFVVKSYLSISKKENIIKSFIIFLSKRFLRIYPALFIYIILSTLIYLFFFENFYFNYVIKSSLYSLFGISNVFYMHQGDSYFYNNFFNPFLHTWSLSVELQFYTILAAFLSLCFFLNIILFIFFYFQVYFW